MQPDHLPPNPAVIEFLKHKWKGTCPMCQAKNWWVPSNQLFQLTEIERPKDRNANLFYITSKSSIAVIPVTCNNCGLTLLLNPQIDVSLKQALDL
jgi:predicted nucleic-acid-binding Zn-ribbon protein